MKKKRRGNFKFVDFWWFSGVEVLGGLVRIFVIFLLCWWKGCQIKSSGITIQWSRAKKRYEMREKRKCGGKGGFNVKKICRKFLGVLCDFFLVCFWTFFFYFLTFFHIELRGGWERIYDLERCSSSRFFWAFRRLLTSPQYVKKKKLHTTTRKNSP